MKKHAKIIVYLLPAVFLLMAVSCKPQEVPPPNDFYFDGPNISDVLFGYYADHYTDTYVLADGKAEIRAEYEFFSAWGCLSYYIPLENAVATTVKDYTFAELAAAPDSAAATAESYFTEKYDWLSLRIRLLRFTNIQKVE